MEIIFYKNTDEVASFPKHLGEGFSVTGTLRNECNVVNPIIEFSNYPPNCDYNYAYIPDFKRYYFITGCTSVRQNVTELSFHVDVLQTYRNEILSHTAFINRATNVDNPYVVDDFVPLIPYKTRFYTELSHYDLYFSRSFENFNSPNFRNIFIAAAGKRPKVY